MAHPRSSFGGFGRLWKGRRVLAGVLAALALSAAAHAIGVTVPWEYDFKIFPTNYVYAHGDSKIVDDGAGGRMLVNSSNGDIFAVFVTMHGKYDQTLRVTVTAATGAGAAAQLGLIGQVVKDSVPQQEGGNFGWNLPLKTEFSDVTFDVLIPENFRQKGQDLFLLFYRSNLAGTLKIKKVKIEVAPPPAAVAAAPQPAAAPAKPAEEEQVFCPFSIFPEGTGDSLKLDFFPLGVYCNGELGPWKDQAKAEGVDATVLADRMYKEIAEMGANVVYFQATGLGPDGRFPLLAAEMARIAVSHGLKVIGQPDDLWYEGMNPAQIKRTGLKTSWEYYRTYTVPTAEQRLPPYRDNPDIWGWSPVEELHGWPRADWERVEWEMAEYRRVIWKLNPKVRIYELQAQLDAMKAMKVPYPNVYGIDRYCFGNGQYNGQLVMWTPNLALRWLRPNIAMFMDQAEKMNRPCVFVMDSITNYTFDDPSMFPQLKTAAEKASFSLPAMPSLRYYPKFDKFGQWSLYFPPKNGMRAMCWVGILEGAKGLFCWAYGNFASKADCMAKGVDYWSGLTKGRPSWADTQKAFAEIKPYGQLLLALHKEPVCGVTASDSLYVWSNTFKDAEGRRFAILVNTRTVTWDKTSPDTLKSPETKFDIDDDGNACNYEVAPPLTFTVTLPSGAGGLQALRDGTSVKPVAGGYELTLEPGQGVVLYIGPSQDVGPIQARYGLVERKP